MDDKELLAQCLELVESGWTRTAIANQFNISLLYVADVEVIQAKCHADVLRQVRKRRLDRHAALSLSRENEVEQLAQLKLALQAVQGGF